MCVTDCGLVGPALHGAVQGSDALAGRREEGQPALQRAGEGEVTLVGVVQVRHLMGHHHGQLRLREHGHQSGRQMT